MQFRRPGPTPAQALVPPAASQSCTEPTSCFAPDRPNWQAGHLEKALEIMAWLEQSGVQFDNTTYEELIGTAEIAEVCRLPRGRMAGE